MPTLRHHGPALAATLLALGGLAACSDDGGSTAEDPATGSTDAGTGVSCEYPAGGAAAKEVEPPPTEATVSGEVPMTLSTSAGDISATLTADGTPCTVNSFVSLAEQGYFDASQCHRLTTAGIFVLQCGDPTASGMGGPGYSFPDELSGEETYGAGTLAMANAGPDTNGSQFFIVYDESQLPPAYTVFGTIDEASLEVVRDIAAKGAQGGAPDGPPKETVEIESVEVG
ncbi:peptidylprolyl isomerase [Nocardioides sp. GCM10027113]|uniref:peptidylprolyl isomerase n=1 Tax=unclassified Nocardioides TaxID=2615069 RepID=UPI0036153C79